MTRSSAILLPLLVTFGVLVVSLVLLLDEARVAIPYPYQLDYGEGIVWQQLRSIADGRGYAPLDGFPDIVFHYPPVYHLASWLLATAGGMDGLVAGRLATLLSTLSIAALAGAVATRLTADHLPRSWRLAAGGATALMFLAWGPVRNWAFFMRVDMLALALTMAGLLLSLHALRRPRLIYPAALAFVAAVFTKQTMVAAPAALFFVLLLARPRLAVRGLAACLLLGLVPLIGLTVHTDGHFLRHLFLYNINRFHPVQLLQIPQVALAHAGILAVAGLAAVQLVGELRVKLAGGLRSFVQVEDRTLAGAIILAYVAIASVMTLLIAKSGAAPNYLIEWLAAASILAGVYLPDWVWRLRNDRNERLISFAGVSLLIAFQAGASLVLTPRYNDERLTEYRQQTAAIERLVRSATAPVLSDEMVLLIRADRDVLWESAIFAELGTTGRYDLAPLARQIGDRRFAMIVTEGRRGDLAFDLRYPAIVADAIDRAYARKEEIAGLTVHLPTPAPGLASSPLSLGASRPTHPS